MRRALLVALAACSSKSSTPSGPGSAAPPVHAPAGPRPTMRSTPPIDLDNGITGVQLVPIMAATGSGVAEERGVFELRWHAATRAADVMCRVDAYNLAYLENMPDPVNAAENEHEQLYRPDPFAVRPTVCEARFYDDHRAMVTRACYQHDTLTAGACPAGTFPAPKIPAGMGISVEGASVHALGNASTGIAVKALFTLPAPLGERKPGFAITCDGVESTASGGEAFVPLSKLAAGETLYTWSLTFVMKSEVAKNPPASCELRITTTTEKDKKPAPLGTFCIAEGSTEPGPCSK